VVLLGNLGAVQAAALGPARVRELVAQIGADALCLHLNPAQELVQPHGDRDFRGQLAAIATLVEQLAVPVIVKETGCGLSVEAALALGRAGVTCVDVSGAGGTSWVAVEAERAGEGSNAAALGDELREWGLPTAVAVAACVEANLVTIASGGLRSGHDIARALALGARAGGMAAPILRAQRAGGEPAVREVIARAIASIRAACLLTGCRRVGELASAPRHIAPPLRAFLADLGLSGRARTRFARAVDGAPR
jgi:isopentenyl-diphosphate delta-isomerase